MKQVEKQHYQQIYDNKVRFASYWHQIDEINALQPTSVLDIGIGNAFIARHLLSAGQDVTTLDIDPELGPDIVGSVTRIPLSEKSFSVVSCCQVLEHMEYRHFTAALTELRRVARHYVLISLPDRYHHLCLLLKFYPHFTIPLALSFPRLFPKRFEFDGEHYWEIGHRGFGLGKIRKSIDDAGMSIVKSYRVFENSLHHFFLLQ